MSDERKTEKPKIENLELNKETLQELTEQEGEEAKGGRMTLPTERFSCQGQCTTLAPSCNPMECQY